MPLTPTSEQRAIIDVACERRESLMIRAFAGCSKTTTLQMLAAALPLTTNMLYLVFNKKNQVEAQKKFPPNVKVMTINGLGHQAFGRTVGARLTLDEKKLGKIVTQQFKAEGLADTGDMWTQVRELVTVAMQAGVVPAAFAPRKGIVPDTPDIWNSLAFDCSIYNGDVAIATHFAQAVLTESIKQGFAGTISFDDQVYLSALFGGVFPRFPLVLVDEAQDQSQINHIMIRKCAADRLIVVGDPQQAIYGFRGADTNSMESMKAMRPEWIELPLATTFRCPKVIVARQQTHAPGFTAWPSNRDGQHVKLPLKLPDTEAYISWQWADVEGIQNIDEPQYLTYAVLCRNNAPLLSLAFKLLRSGTACVMAGRDIGKGLLVLAKKLMPLDDIAARDCIQLISDWRDREEALARANGADSKVAGIADRAECLLAVLDSAKASTSGDLRASLTRLFARDTGKVTLSSIHRAKGLEWDVVVHLDPWRIPSKFARNDPRQMQQEVNLRYVAETRTKHTLIEANLEDFSP